MESVGRRLFHASAIALAAILIFALTPSGSALAARHHHYRRHYHHRHYRHHPRVRVPLYRAELLEDAYSGRILYQDNAGMEWPPASMAKMTLLLVTEDEIKAGKIRLDDPVRISERAAHTMGSHIQLKEGQVYPLRALIKAALINSANNAAVAIGEKIGGSVEGAVRMMNLKAKSLGMTGTHYRTVDGLPPRPGQDVDVTNAHDLAIVARALILRTDLLKWSRLKQAPFDGGLLMLHNTNHLIGRYPGCDGLKTGFTFHAGFNLTATARRGRMRLIAVVLGAPSNPERFIQAARLMSWGFDHFKSVEVMKRGQKLPVSVQIGSGPRIHPVAAENLNVVVRKSEVSKIRLTYDVPRVVAGPIAGGHPIGKIIVSDNGGVLREIDALCPVSVGAPDEDTTAALR